MKTTTDLNTKVWYRAIKVIYGLLFLVIVTLILSLPEEALDISNSKIVCQYGNGKQFLVKEVFDKKGMPTILPTHFDSEETEFSKKILEICEISQVVTQKMFESGSDFVPDPYRIEEKYKVKIDYLILSLLTIIATFEAVRRIFYYIVLGSIKPQK